MARFKIEYTVSRENYKINPKTIYKGKILHQWNCKNKKKYQTILLKTFVHMKRTHTKKNLINLCTLVQ